MIEQQGVSLAERLDRMPLSNFHWRLTLMVGTCMMIGGMSLGIFPLAIVSIKKDWALTLTQVSWMVSISNMIIFATSFIWGSLANRLERKLFLMISLVALSLGTGLCGLATNLGTLIVSRSIQMSSFLGLVPVGVALIVELAPKTYRGRLFSTSQILWPIGDAIGIAMGCFLIPLLGWRFTLLIASLAIIYVFYLWGWAPKSPRFLEASGHWEEAVKAVRGVEAACHVEPAILTRTEIPHAGPQKDGVKPGWLDLWRDGRARRTAMISLLSFAYQYFRVIVVQWLPILLVSFGHTILESFRYVFIFALASIPAPFISAVIIDRLGRKGTLTTYLFGCILASLCFGYFAHTAAAIVIFGCCLRFFMTAIRGGAEGYIQENYPTKLRALGGGWNNAISGFAGILCPFIIGLLVNRWPGRQDIVFLHITALFAIAVIAVLAIGQETKGQSLDEAGPVSSRLSEHMSSPRTSNPISQGIFPQETEILPEGITSAQAQETFGLLMEAIQAEPPPSKDSGIAPQLGSEEKRQQLNFRLLFWGMLLSSILGMAVFAFAVILAIRVFQVDITSHFKYEAQPAKEMISIAPPALETSSRNADAMSTPVPTIVPPIDLSKLALDLVKTYEVPNTATALGPLLETRHASSKKRFRWKSEGIGDDSFRIKFYVGSKPIYIFLVRPKIKSVQGLNKAAKAALAGNLHKRPRKAAKNRVQ